jgi:hypothetical protein
VRFKVVPEPRSRTFLAEVRAAVPLVPGSVEDCCQRVVARTDVPGRDDAREWLTFLRALGLVEETGSGYRRTREDPDDALAANFRQRVHLADDVVAALGDEPRNADDVFAAVREAVPRWERDRHDDWEAVWRDRVARLLGWAAVFGLAAERDGGYLRSRDGA